MKNKLTEKNRHLVRLRASYAFKYPAHLVRQKEQQLDTSIERLHGVIKSVYTQNFERLQTLSKRMYLQKPEQKLLDAKLQVQKANESLQTEMKRILEWHNKDILIKMDNL